ncbi:Ras-related protein Rab-13 [Durusdinium trenchii]|uniref:Ras-related protein Rab-13 n=1 Tax=Durusdinium trenchii TaxID=1381693 RepID=A0ABP0RTB3_9DINO
MSRGDYDLLFKIVLAGDADVGKTSLLARYVKGTFSESYQSTIGVDFQVKTLSIEGRTVKLQVWDTGGQERFASLVSAYFRGCHGVVLVFDLSKRNSFERVQPWLERAKEHAQEDVEVLVVGNKSDLEPEVSREEAEELATTLQAAYVETSAKCDEASVVGAFESLAQRILEHRPCGGGYAYGPPPEPAYTYRPPPHLPGLPVNGPRSCCHFLGPPGNAYHEGSHSDRGDIMERSKTLEEIVSLSPTALAPFAAALYAARPAVLRGRSVPPFQCRSMELQTFLASLRGDDATRRNLYLQQLPVLQHLPELEQLQVPVRGPQLLQEALGQSGLVTCTLFCGAEGIKTSLHFDRGDWARVSAETDARSSIDNLFLQLSGRKRFRLFRPCDHDRLYARGAADPSAPHVSRVDTWGSSEVASFLKEFPLFGAAKARSFEVELGPGDALLLPRWWWHQSEALSDGHAINWWFEPKRAKVSK